ncbi:MAG: Na/Pi cotransporter family protein, partial [Clostridium sp.]
LPFSKYILMFTNRIIPDDEEKETPYSKYLDDRFLETPVVAAGQVIKETIRMANKARDNVELAMKAFFDNDESLIENVYENEKTINLLDEEITNYLVKLSKTNLPERDQDMMSSIFHTIIDIERIGDHAENISDLAREKIRRNAKYNTDALNDLNEIYNSVIKSLDTSIRAYTIKNITDAEENLKTENQIDLYRNNYRKKQIKRIYEGKCSAFEGALFLDLISDLERIDDHSHNIAKTVIDNMM